jgi:ABC-type transport system involved in multi-copper enzyme maturation permease subunit
MINPVFRYELVRTARRDLTYGVRLAYGLVLLLGLAGAYALWDFESARQATPSLRHFAEATFHRFALLQDVALVALVPALVAGAVAEEAQRHALSSLLTTRLTAFEIVVGKVAARLVHVGVFFLIGLPVVALLGLVGGVGLELILSAYAGAFGLAFLTAGLSILLSTLCRTPLGAIASAYGALAAWLCLPLWIRPMVTGLTGPLAWAGTLDDAIVRSSPVWTWAARGFLSSLAHRGRGFQMWIRVVFFWSDWPWRAALHATLGLCCVALAALTLRTWQGDAPNRIGRRWSKRALIAPKRSPCGAAPMRWKERHTAQGGRAVRWAAWIIGVLLIAGLAQELLVDTVRVLQVRASFDVSDVIGYNESERLRQVHMTLFALWTLAVACAAALGSARAAPGTHSG